MNIVFVKHISRAVNNRIWRVALYPIIYSKKKLVNLVGLTLKQNTYNHLFIIITSENWCPDGSHNVVLSHPFHSLHRARCFSLTLITFFQEEEEQRCEEGMRR